MKSLNLVNVDGNLDIYLGDRAIARIENVGNLTDEEVTELIQELWNRRKPTRNQ